MIIDVHGHYTTVPAALRVYRATQISQLANPAKGILKISDDEIRTSLLEGQVKLMDERGIDVMLFSPMASAMGHHFGNAKTSQYWTEHNNELIHRICKLMPERFVGVCSLPQFPGIAPKDCISELRRCVEEFGFVGCNLNPDPSGGQWNGPPLSDETWYPLYESLQQLDVPAMIHGSASCNPAFHTVGCHYLNVDSTAIMQLLESRLLSDFPRLRLIISHGGGNFPYQYARYQALAIANNWMPIDNFIKRLYFDSTVYSVGAMAMLIKTIGIDNVLFGSEMLGGVPGLNPDSGMAFDDNKRLIESIPELNDADRRKIFQTNALAAYPRLRSALEARFAEVGDCC